jgi:hypothetical protein
MTEYRPTFVLWASFLALVPITLFFALWAGLFFGGMLSSVYKDAAFTQGGMFGGLAFAIGGAVLVLFPVVMLIVRAMNYRNTVYRVLSDRIEIDEGFLAQHRKEVRLSAVREVDFRCSVLQRMAGLGSIYLATQATGNTRNWNWSTLAGSTSALPGGVLLMDLANPDAAYQQLLGRVRTAARRAETAGSRSEDSGAG